MQPITEVIPNSSPFTALEEVINALTSLARRYIEGGCTPAQAVAFGAEDYRRSIIKSGVALESDGWLLRLQMVNIISPRRAI